VKKLQKKLQELLLDYINGKKEFEGDRDQLEKFSLILLALGVKSEIKDKKLIIL
jgi:hypothetical protein